MKDSGSRIQDSGMWIPCTERMPDTEEVVAVVCQKKDGRRSWNRAFWDGRFWHGSGSFAAVTHWMRIELPEEH